MTIFERQKPLEIKSPTKQMYPILQRGDTILTLEAQGGIFRFGDLRIGKPLTPNNLTVLLNLIDSFGYTVNTRELLLALSPRSGEFPKYYPSEVLRPLIFRLKNQLCSIDESLPNMVQTHHGHGYRFAPHESVASWYGLDLRQLTHPPHKN